MLSQDSISVSEILFPPCCVWCCVIVSRTACDISKQNTAFRSKHFLVSMESLKLYERQSVGYFISCGVMNLFVHRSTMQP